MQPLHKRSTAPRSRTLSKEAPTLDHQSGQLLGYLDTLFQRLVLPRQPVEPALECSREEIRALILLGSSGRMIMSDFAAGLGVPLSTATHTVDRLVEKVLVVRNRRDEDRRVVELEMSENGRKLQASFRSKRQGMARSWLAALSPGEREIFLELMAKITLRSRPEPERPNHE
jgi:DNA-binding MarR family transcriptional regulator